MIFCACGHLKVNGTKYSQLLICPKCFDYKEYKFFIHPEIIKNQRNLIRRVAVRN